MNRYMIVLYPFLSVITITRSLTGWGRDSLGHGIQRYLNGIFCSKLAQNVLVGSGAQYRGIGCRIPRFFFI